VNAKTVKVSTGSQAATNRIVSMLHQMGHHSVANELARRNTGKWCYITVTQPTLALINKAQTEVDLQELRGNIRY
jgi:hypothetical protein